MHIKMEEVSQNATKYTDIVDLYAGWLTPLAAWWTLKFYRPCCVLHLPPVPKLCFQCVEY